MPAIASVRILLCMFLFALTTIGFSAETIRVGCFDYYPGIFQNKQGKADGFFYDLLQEIAKKEGWQLEFVHGSWTDGLKRIQNGEVDMLTSVAYSTERASYMDYTKEPLLLVWGGVYVRRSSSIEGIFDLRGKRVAIMRNDFNAATFKNHANSFGIQCEYTTVPDFTAVFQAVEAGKADAGVINSTPGTALCSQYNLKGTSIVFNPFDIYITVKKGKHSAALAAVDRYLHQWKADPDSIYYRALKKWLRQDIYIQQSTPRWIIHVCLFLIGLFAISLSLIYTLRHLVRSRTTALEESNQRLRESECRFQAFMNETPVYAYIKDCTLNHVYQNQRIMELIQQTKPHDVTHSARDLFDATIADMLESADKKILTGEKTQIELEYPVVINGKTVWLNDIKFKIQQEGGEIHVGGLAYDITARKTAEMHLQESEDNLRVTLNSIGDAVISTDTQGCIMQMNPVAENLTEWRLAEAKGRPLSEVFQIVDGDTRESRDSPVRKVLESGEITGLSQNTLLVARSKKEYCIADSAAPICDESKKVTGVVLIFRDITEESLLQQQLQQSQKLDAIGQLAGGIAHDFNNMLGGVIGGAELLSQQLPPGDQEAVKFLEMIMHSAERAAELAGKLLAFSRQKMVHSTPIDVHEAIRDAVCILKNTIDKRINIQCELAAESSTVIGDCSQLQSVFLNLGINASHAMPEGGELLFLSKVIELSYADGKERVLKLNPGRYIRIEVKDTGCGIEPHNIPRIFEPFFTTKEQGKGTGLGLATVYGIIQQHNGAITVESEVAKGTSFQLLLPLTSQAIAATNTKEVVLSGHGTILLVDDESVMRTVGARLLTQCGYQVILAENGKMALEIFQERTEEIDLVILDMIMPEMNGRDCFYKIKKIRPQQRVILSSGFSKFEDIMDLKDHGLSGFIHKPFHTYELSKVVQQVLAKTIPPASS